MPLKTPTLAVLATLVVVLFTYQYLASTPGDLDTYIPLSPNSAKFGSEVPGLNSNIQDAQDLDWDDLPEGGGELLSGEAGASEQRRVKVDLGVMSRCPDAVSLRRNERYESMLSAIVAISGLLTTRRGFANQSWTR